MGDFGIWCRSGDPRLGDGRPVHVASYIEGQQAKLAAPSVKQHLAAIPRLYDWLVVGQIVASQRVNRPLVEAKYLKQISFTETRPVTQQRQHYDFLYNPAWDNISDTRSCSYGFVTALVEQNWKLAFGVFMAPNTVNGADFDFIDLRELGYNLELTPKPNSAGTCGLGDFIKNALSNEKGIRVTFVFGSSDRQEEKANSHIDLIVIGGIGFEKTDQFADGFLW